MDQSGLPLRSGGMRKSDPVSLRMEEIIWGSEGRKVALVATDKVLPALCGVEPLLKKELGDRCNPHDIGTNRADLIIGELMTHLAYSAAGEAKPPRLRCMGRKKLAENLKAFARETLEASPTDLEIADGKVREFVGRVITSSKKLASMLYREYVCV